MTELQLAALSPLPILILAQLCAEAFEAYRITAVRISDQYRSYLINLGID